MQIYYRLLKLSIVDLFFLSSSFDLIKFHLDFLLIKYFKVNFPFYHFNHVEKI